MVPNILRKLSFSISTNLRWSKYLLSLSDTEFLPPPGGPMAQQKVPELANCLAIVPAAEVHPLPDLLKRRLGFILMQRGHVQVVNEEDKVFAQRRSEDALASLVQLRVNEVLCLVRRCLGREVKELWSEVLGHGARQFVNYSQSLAGTCRPHAQYCLVVLEQELDQEGVAHVVNGRHDDVGELDVAGEAELREIGHPVLPADRLHHHALFFLVFGGLVEDASVVDGVVVNEAVGGQGQAEEIGMRLECVA